MGENHEVDTFGPYVVQSLIGSGGFAHTHEARDSHGSKVALKVLHPEHCLNAETRERFVRELEAAQTLSDQLFARVLDWDLNVARPWLCFTFAEGRDLDDLIREEAPLKFDRVRLITWQLIRALEELVIAQMVHRDLKPRNIRIGPGDAITVLDLGIAYSPNREPITQNLLGTLEFMAPERLDGEPSTPAVDVWAVGLIVAKLASGRHPFGYLFGATSKLIQGIRLEDPDLSTLPLPWRPLVSACLAKDPTVRPSAEEMLALVPADDLRLRAQHCGRLAATSAVDAWNLAADSRTALPTDWPASRARFRKDARIRAVVAQGAAAVGEYEQALRVNPGGLDVIAAELFRIGDIEGAYVIATAEPSSRFATPWQCSCKSPLWALSTTMVREGYVAEALHCVEKIPGPGSSWSDVPYHSYEQHQHFAVMRITEFLYALSEGNHRGAAYDLCKSLDDPEQRSGGLRHLAFIAARNGKMTDATSLLAEAVASARLCFNMPPEQRPTLPHKSIAEYEDEAVSKFNEYASLYSLNESVDPRYRSSVAGRLATELISTAPWVARPMLELLSIATQAIESLGIVSPSALASHIGYSHSPPSMRELEFQVITAACIVADTHPAEAILMVKGIRHPNNRSLANFFLAKEFVSSGNFNEAVTITQEILAHSPTPFLYGGHSFFGERSQISELHSRIFRVQSKTPSSDALFYGHPGLEALLQLSESLFRANERVAGLAVLSSAASFASKVRNPFLQVVAHCQIITSSVSFGEAEMLKASMSAAHEVADSIENQMLRITALVYLAATMVTVERVDLAFDIASDATSATSRCEFESVDSAEILGVIASVFSAISRSP